MLSSDKCYGYILVHSQSTSYTLESFYISDTQELCPAA